MLSVLILPGSIALLLALEVVIPRSGARPERFRRWIANGALGLIAYGLGRLVAGTSLVALALWAQQRGIGLLNVLALPVWLETMIAIVLLDGIIWAQHAAFHAIPALWPLHRVHHSDNALDVSTAWRFHPGEVVISLCVKAAAVVLIGASAVAVISFALLLAVSAMFNHAHMRLPGWLDSVLSLLIVTPDAHRVHHACNDRLDHTNYGFFLNIWDRFAGCYRRYPAQETDALQLGTSGYQPDTGLMALMLQPFRAPKT